MFSHFLGKQKAFYYTIGLQVGIETKNREFYRNGYEPPLSGPKPFSIWGTPDAIQWGGNLGVGYQRKVNQSFLIDVNTRLNADFLDFTNNSSGPFLIPTARTYALSLALGVHYLIP